MKIKIDRDRLCFEVRGKYTFFVLWFVIGTYFLGFHRLTATLIKYLSLRIQSGNFVSEKELLDEMEVIKAQKTLECDELESRLKRQLVDRTSKLRQAQSEVKMLNLEISNLRDQISIQQVIILKHKFVLKVQP